MLIPDDTTRCYGSGCSLKADCLRYQQISIDSEAARRGEAGLHPYVATLAGDDGDCHHKLEVEYV